MSRQEIAEALETDFTGRSVSAYVEGGQVIPIVYRAPAKERAEVPGTAARLPTTSRVAQR